MTPFTGGHITAAQAAAQQLGLDLLLLIPASIPPHKALPEGGADAAQRLEMATLATAELSCPAQVLDVEVKRQGKSSQRIPSAPCAGSTRRMSCGC